MGLFSFIKDAGQAVFGKEDEKKEEATKADLSAVLERKREKALADMVGKVGLTAEDLSIDIEGDKATVTGRTDSEETREKIVLMLGNTQGIAEVDDRLEVTASTAATAAAATAASGATVGAAQVSPAGSVFHTVERGDTLWAIAKKHYGDGNRYRAIFEANQPMLDNPDRIYPGQVLRIPKSS